MGHWLSWWLCSMGCSPCLGQQTGKFHWDRAFAAAGTSQRSAGNKLRPFPKIFASITASFCYFHVHRHCPLVQPALQSPHPHQLLSPPKQPPSALLIFRVVDGWMDTQVDTDCVFKCRFHTMEPTAFVLLPLLPPPLWLFLSFSPLTFYFQDT